jgi:hypothetical protein
MLGMPITITTSGSSVAANALALPINPRWATDGTARRVVFQPRFVTAALTLNSCGRA